MSLKLEGFTEAKRRILRAIDYRIEQLPKNGGMFDAETNRDVCERVDELNKLRAFVRGMVTENPEYQKDTNKNKVDKFTKSS